MNLKNLLTTCWTYARSGAPYVSFPLSLYSTAALTEVLFPSHFLQLLVFGSLGVLGTMIFFGWFHFGAPFKKDNDIAAKANQYNFRALPGITTDLNIPTQIIVLKAMKKIADKEDQARFDYFIQIWEGLAQGKDLREIMMKGLE